MLTGAQVTQKLNWEVPPPIWLLTHKQIHTEDSYPLPGQTSVEDVEVNPVKEKVGWKVGHHKLLQLLKESWLAIHVIRFKMAPEHS